MQISDHEKVKLLTNALKQYASLINWSRCNPDDIHLTKWYGDGNGCDLAKNILDIIEGYDKISIHDISAK